MKMDATNADKFWEKHARKYDRATLFLNRSFSVMAARVASDLAGRARVLEIAAGTGLVTVRLAEAVGHLVATDRSREMLQVLKARIRGSSFERVALQQTDVFQLPFASGVFDGAVVANLLHLLPEPERALREIRRVLKPDGVLAAPTFEHGASLIAQATSRALALAGFPVQTRFRSEMLRDLVERAGYQVDHAEVFPGILPLRYVRASPANRAPTVT
jgi:ubiquinone/menaquinone biosynthesis C-methylase UbiE